MDAKEITEREIGEFLLGGGEAPLVERIEELTITDADFAVRVEAVERDLVDEYAAGEMDANDRWRFESHYLASPLRREKLRFAEVLSEYASRSPTAEIQEESAESKGALGASWLSGLLSWRPAFQMAIAAGVVLAAVGMIWWFVGSVGRNEIAMSDSNPGLSNVVQSGTGEGPTGTSTPAPQIDGVNSAQETRSPEVTATPDKPPTPTANKTPASAKPPAIRRPVIASLVLAPPVRGGQPPNLHLPVDAERVAVRLGLDATDFTAYRVVLRSGDSTVWQSGTIRRTGQRLDLTIPAKRLNPRIYRFTVSGIAADGTSEIIGDYPFQIVR